MNQPINFRRRLDTPADILKVLPQATEIKEVAAIYSANIDMVENNPTVSAAIIARKKALYGNDRPLDAETRPQKTCTY